jgi:hypothetical protein
MAYSLLEFAERRINRQGVYYPLRKINHKQMKKVITKAVFIMHSESHTQMLKI